ncbi:MAG: site-2 protease family protein [Gammaproteobacteria bacterium]
MDRAPRGYRLFEIAGFEVKLDPSWLLLALLIAWTLAAGVFPQKYPHLQAGTYWAMGAVCAVGILLSIVFHELAHSLVARRYGLPMKGITLFIFGGMAEMGEEAKDPKTEFLMAIAGPIASVVLGAVFYGLHQLGQDAGIGPFWLGITYYLGWINFILAIFNLVPAFPLDGGRMLRAALWRWGKDLRKATRIAAAIGSAFGLALIVLGAVGIIGGNFIGGLWYILIGLFLRGAARGSLQQVLVREYLEDVPVSRFMTTEPIALSPELNLEDAVQDYFFRHHHRVFPVVDKGRLAGCLSADDVKAVPRQEWTRRRVRDAMSPCGEDYRVSPDEDASNVLSGMAAPDGRTRLMVVDAEGRLVGVVSLKDLREHLALRLRLDGSNPA